MGNSDESYVKEYVLDCRREAEAAKSTRMSLNRDNYDMFHLRHDFTHKKSGQSTEILSKQKMATEQIRSFFQQALVNVGDWWKCATKDGTDGAGNLIRPHEVYKLTNYMLTRANFYSHIGNCVQEAILGALAIPKVHGCMKSSPKFRTRKEGRGKTYRKWVETTDDKTWELKLDIIRGENYFPDPTGSDLYEIEDCYMDLHHVKQLAEQYDLYDKAVVAELQPWGNKEEDQSKARETGQNAPPGARRAQVKITEFWGTIVDTDTGEIMHENCVVTLANDEHVIRKPTPNPLWHQRTPIIRAALMEVANSVWHTALADAGTKHNHALTEMFNLVLDSAMKAVHGISQIRIDDLDDIKQIANGIPFGTTLKVRSSLAPGMKVMEPVVTGSVPTDALNVMNVLGQEFNASMLTNDLRQGVMPFRAVKATEVVEASNTITSVFQGVAKNVETKLIQPQLELAWQTTAQNWDLIDAEVFVSLFGKERGEELSRMEPQEVFVATVNGLKFDVFGISLTMSKQADFRKLTTLMQTVAASDMFIEAFLAKYSPTKFIGEVMTALDIDKYKLEIDEASGPPQGMPQPPQAGPPQAGPDQMSQVPQAGAGSLSDIFGGASQPQRKFPGSPATAGQGG